MCYLLQSLHVVGASNGGGGVFGVCFCRPVKSNDACQLGFVRGKGAGHKRRNVCVVVGDSVYGLLHRIIIVRLYAGCGK